MANTNEARSVVLECQVHDAVAAAPFLIHTQLLLRRLVLSLKDRWSSYTQILKISGRKP